MQSRNRKEKLNQLTVTKLDKIIVQRSMEVYKADELLQKARYTLSITEQKLILYTISKIKPTDKAFKEYVYSLKEFMTICGCEEHDSYTHIKNTCRKLSDKSWWLLMEDPHAPGTMCESLVRWFSTLRTNKGKGTITIKFHEDMFPYLLELSKHFEDGHIFYTHYELQNILAFKSTYSIRLYELLKSYQKNNEDWWFKIDNLKYILDCDSYEWYDFKRRVLTTSINEINKYSDLDIDYYTEKDGRKIDKITFFMTEKDKSHKIQSHQKALTDMEGNIHYWDIR